MIDKCVNTPSYGLRLDFGFSYDAFLVALDYMYGVPLDDKIHLSDAADVQVVAHKLELNGLKKRCEKVLESSIIDDEPVEESSLTASTTRPESRPEISPSATTKTPTKTTTTTTTTKTPTKTIATATPISPFSTESSFAELTKICAEFTATVLNGDKDASPLVDFERVESEMSQLGRSSDPPLSSVDVSRKKDFNSSGGIFNNELQFPQVYSKGGGGYFLSSE